MDTHELRLMESRVAVARKLVAEVRSLGEDTSVIEELVVQLELLLTTLRMENGGREDRAEAG
jgi:hypothetical protein